MAKRLQRPCNTQIGSNQCKRFYFETDRRRPRKINLSFGRSTWIFFSRRLNDKILLSSAIEIEGICVDDRRQQAHQTPTPGNGTFTPNARLIYLLLIWNTPFRRQFINRINIKRTPNVCRPFLSYYIRFSSRLFFFRWFEWLQNTLIANHFTRNLWVLFTVWFASRLHPKWCAWCRDVVWGSVLLMVCECDSLMGVQRDRRLPLHRRQ